MSLRISVVVPTLNDSTLANTLEALQRQRRRPDEIIVVGRDERGVTHRYPTVQFLDTGKPVCAAAARNMGIIASTGDVIAFTDSDCIPDTEWLGRHDLAHRAGREIVGGGVSLEGSNYWAQADNVSMFHAFLSRHPPGTRMLLPTLNLSVRRSVVEAVGYLDETFPGAAAEDTDWSIRMRRAGYMLHFEPGAVVCHAPARTRWRDVALHWRNLGYSAIRVRQRYPDEFRTPRFARYALLLRALSPLIAVCVTIQIYANPLLWRYLTYLPVVYLSKIIYCFGAATSIDQGFAFSEETIYPVPTS